MLTHEQYQEIITLLRHVMGDTPPERKARLEAAFPRAKVLTEINCDGDNSDNGDNDTFAENLLRALLHYGDYAQDEPAAWTLLQSRREFYGFNWQRKIDVIGQVLSAPGFSDNPVIVPPTSTPQIAPTPALAKRRVRVAPAGRRPTKRETAAPDSESSPTTTTAPDAAGEDPIAA